jgi:hypothetical protein
MDVRIPVCLGADGGVSGTSRLVLPPPWLDLSRLAFGQMAGPVTSGAMTGLGLMARSDEPAFDWNATLLTTSLLRLS